MHNSKKHWVLGSRFANGRDIRGLEQLFRAEVRDKVADPDSG